MADPSKPKNNPWQRPDKEDRERTRRGNRVRYLSDLHVPGQLFGAGEEVDESLYVSKQEIESNINRTPWQMTSEEMRLGKNQMIARDNKDMLDKSIGITDQDNIFGDAFSTIMDGFSWVQQMVRRSPGGQAFASAMHSDARDAEYDIQQRTLDELQRAKATGHLGSNIWSSWKDSMVYNQQAMNIEDFGGFISDKTGYTEITDPVSGEVIRSDIPTLVKFGLIPAIGDGYIDSVNNEYKQVTKTQQIILAEEAQPLINQIVLGAFLDPTTYAPINAGTWIRAARLAKAGGVKLLTTSKLAYENAKRIGLDFIEFRENIMNPQTVYALQEGADETISQAGARAVHDRRFADYNPDADDPAGEYIGGIFDYLGGPPDINERVAAKADKVLETTSGESPLISAALKLKHIIQQLTTGEYDVLKDIKRPSKKRVEQIKEDLIIQRDALVKEIDDIPVDAPTVAMQDREDLIVAQAAQLRRWVKDPDMGPNQYITNVETFRKEVLSAVDGDIGLAIRYGVDIGAIDEALDAFKAVKREDYSARDYGDTIGGLNAYDVDKQDAFSDLMETMSEVRPRHLTDQDVITQRKVNTIAEQAVKSDPDPVMPTDRGIEIDEKLSTPHRLDVAGDEATGGVGGYHKVATAGDAAIYKGADIGKGVFRWAAIGLRKKGSAEGFDQPVYVTGKAKPTMETIEKAAGGADNIEWHPSAMQGRRGGGVRRKKWTEYKDPWAEGLDDTQRRIRFQKLYDHGKLPAKVVPVEKLDQATGGGITQASRDLQLADELENVANVSPPTSDGLTVINNKIKKSNDLAPPMMFITGGEIRNGPKYIDQAKWKRDVDRGVRDPRSEIDQHRVEIIQTADEAEKLRRIAENEEVVVVNRDYPFGLRISIPYDIELYDVQNNIILSGPDEYINLLMADPNQRVLYKDDINPRAILNAAYDLLGEDNITNAMHNNPLRAMRAFEELDKSADLKFAEIKETQKLYDKAATEPRSKKARKRKTYDKTLLKEFGFPAMVDELSAQPEYHIQVRGIVGKSRTVVVARYRALKKFIELYENTVFEAGSKEPIKLILRNKWRGKPQIDLMEGVEAEHYFEEGLDAITPKNYARIKEMATEDEMAKITQGLDINNAANWTDTEVARVTERMQLYVKGLLPEGVSETTQELVTATKELGDAVDNVNLAGTGGRETTRAVRRVLNNGGSNEEIKQALANPELIVGDNIPFDTQLKLFADLVDLNIIEPWYDAPGNEVHKLVGELLNRPGVDPTTNELANFLIRWYDRGGTGEPPNLIIPFDQEFGPDPRDPLSKSLKAWLWIQKNVTDRFVYGNYWTGIGDANHKAMNNGIGLSGKEKAEVMASLTRGSSNSAMYKVRPVFKAIKDSWRQTDTEFATYKEWEDHINHYLIYRQEYDIMTRTLDDGTLAMPDRKMQLLNKDTGRMQEVGPVQIAKYIEAMETSANGELLQRTAMVVTKLYSDQLWKLVELDAITPEFAGFLQDMYKNYIPLNYVQQDFLEMFGPKDRIMSWSGKDPIQRYSKFSPHENIEMHRPLDQLLENVTHLEFYANYNKTASNLVRHMISEGDKTGIAYVQKLQIGKEGNIRKGAELPDHQIVKFREDNKWQAYAIPDEEAKALSTLLNHNGGNMIQTIFRDYINRYAKWLFVHYNPGFLVYQFMFDMINVAFQHGVPGIADTMVNVFRPLAKDPLMERLLQEGGSVGFWKQIDARTTEGGILNAKPKKMLSDMSTGTSHFGSGKGKIGPIPVPIKNIYDIDFNTLKAMTKNTNNAWHRFANHIEMAPRKAAGRRVFKKTGGVIDKNGVLVGGDIQEAALAMRRVTGDFSRGGVATKALDDFFAFANIAVQGGMIPARALKHNPFMFFSALATGVTANAALFAYNMQYDEYSDVPLEYRLGPIFMLPSDPQDVNVYTGKPNPRFIRLLPGSLREWMPIFGTQNYMMAEMFHHNPEGFGALLHEQILEGTPIGTFYGKSGGMRYPGLVTGKISEQVNNKNTWTGQQIVPDHLSHLPLEQQVNGGTSEMAIRVGVATGISPLRIQHGLNMPGFSGMAGAVDLALNAAENNTDSRSYYFAEEILDLMQSQPDEVQAKKVRDQYINQNVEPAIRTEVKRLLYRLSRGKTVQGGPQAEASQWPFVSQFTNRIYHSHGGSLDRTIKEEAQKELGVNKAAQERVDRRLSELFTAVEDREFMSHLALEDTQNTREWKNEQDNIQKMIYGVYELIQNATEYDGSLQDRDLFTEDDVAQYYMDMNTAAVAFGSKDLQIKIHVLGWKAIKPKERPDGTINWYQFFIDRGIYMDKMLADYGEEYVAEFEDLRRSRMNPSQLIFDDRQRDYIRPYFEDSQQNVFDMFTKAGHGEYVQKWIDMQLMTEREREQYLALPTKESAIVSAIDTAMISERQRMRYSDGTLEAMLLMYDYIDTAVTPKGRKMLKFLNELDAAAVEARSTTLLTN